MKEQELIVTTFIKLDKWDRLKILFGRCLKIETKVIVPQEQPIERHNAVSSISIISSSGNFIKQDRPPFGYVSDSLLQPPESHQTVTVEPPHKDVAAFLKWRDKLRKEVRGGIMMYDVPNHYKWMYYKELFDYYMKAGRNIT